MRLLLAGGRVIDPSQNLDREGDLLIEDGKVGGIFDRGAVRDPERMIDCAGQVVCPGLIDMHVHLREPGFEYKEDIASGAAAAAAGGFTAVACMPNTRPAIDTAAVVRFIRERAEGQAARVHVIGAATVGMNEEQLAEIADLKEAGAVAISDDAFPIQSAAMMRRAMEYCATFDLAFIAHCEDKSLSGDGAMHEGLVSTTLGLRGMPAASEDIAIFRNARLAALTGCHLHVAHMASAGGVEIVRRAKEQGWPVTGEACAHHYAITDEACYGYDTNAKMNPPLRSESDVEAIRRGLADDTIDALVTDHAPHAVHEKEQEFALAPYGIVGLETALALSITCLVKPGLLSLPRMIEKYTVQPARLLGLDAGTLRAGAAADVTVFDPEAEWTVEISQFKSKSKNSPFDGFRLTGRAVLTVVGGRVIEQER